jgi:hypothetical protein
MFPVMALSVHRRKKMHCMCALICMAICIDAPAFESWISSTTTPMFAMSVSTFQNTFAQAGSFSTAIEFKSVECKHVTDPIGNIDVASLFEMSEVKLQQVLTLTRRLDDIQYGMCKEMIPSGKSAELTVKLGNAWKTTLKTGDAMQSDMSVILQNEDHVQELIEQYTDQTNKLQAILDSNGGGK